MNLGNITATSVRSTTTGLFQNGQSPTTIDLVQWSTTSGSNQVTLINSDVDLDTLFQSGDTVIISGIASPIGGIPPENIHGTRSVQGFLTHPLDDRESAFLVMADTAATSTATGTFTPYATVTYSPPSLIHADSDLLVHGGEIFSFLQASYHPLSAMDPIPELNSTNLVTSGSIRSAIDDAVSSCAPLADLLSLQADVGSLSSVYHPQTAVDTSPVASSNNLITSGAVHAALEGGAVTDPVPTNGSTNAVQSGGVYDALQEHTTALAGKQDVLTFDATPTVGNTSSVVSSDTMHAMFNDFSTSSTNQDQYVMRAHESRGKMLLQVWHGWSSLAPSPQNFDDLLTSKLQNAT